MNLIATAVPEADGPDWNQKWYVSWKAGTKNWIYLEQQANQATLDIGGLSVGPSDLAEQLGFAVFEDAAELAAKFALGSSVGALPNDDQLRIIIKSVKDIDRAREGLRSMLEQAWARFSR